MPIALGFRLLSIFGLSDKLAKRFAPLGLAIAAILAAVALWGAFQAWDWWDDRQAVKRAEAAREAKAAVSREAAANQRAEDTIRNARNEEELHDAIDAAPTGGELSPAAHALACERLRRLGRIPPACRSPGGDRSEAGSD